MPRLPTHNERDFLQNFLALLMEPCDERDYFQDPLFPEEAEFEHKAQRPNPIATLMSIGINPENGNPL